MASVDEKSSNHESGDVKANSSDGFVLDRNRRAALAEVDNAKFSFVFSSFLTGTCSVDHPYLTVGSMPKFAL